MALGSGTVLEVRPTGSDTLNGGGFNPTRDPTNGVDRSQSDSAFVVIDGVTITATVGATFADRLTITGYTVSTADIGNLVNISGGSATAGIYEIVGLQLGNVWSMDRSTGTVGQTATGGMGGCLASPGKASAAVTGVGDPVVWIKAGTYLLTSSSTTVAGGCVASSSGMWQGYGSSRGDLAGRPILRASGISTATIFQISGNEAWAINLEFDGNNLTAIRGLGMTGRCSIFLCVARNCTNSGFQASPFGGGWYAFCYATGCSTAGYAFNVGGGHTTDLESCIAEGNTVTGFLSSMPVTNCLAINNTGATTDGFFSEAGAVFRRCTAYGNGRDGFGNGNSSSLRWINCLSEGNGRHGFNGTAALRILAIKCGTFGNVGNGINPTVQFELQNFVGASSFFVDAAGGDFTPNTVAGAGALARGSGYTSPFIGHTQQTFPDVGAVQHFGGGVNRAALPSGLSALG